MLVIDEPSCNCCHDSLIRCAAFASVKFFGKKLYSTVIPRSVRLSEAPSYGLPVQYYDPKGKGTDRYNALAKEVVKKS